MDFKRSRSTSSTAESSSEAAKWDCFSSLWNESRGKRRRRNCREKSDENWLLQWCYQQNNSGNNDNTRSNGAIKVELWLNNLAPPLPIYDKFLFLFSAFLLLKKSSGDVGDLGEVGDGDEQMDDAEPADSEGGRTNEWMGPKSSWFSSHPEFQIVGLGGMRWKAKTKQRTRIETPDVVVVVVVVVAATLISLLFFSSLLLAPWTMKKCRKWTLLFDQLDQQICCGVSTP